MGGVGKSGRKCEYCGRFYRFIYIIAKEDITHSGPILFESCIGCFTRSNIKKKIKKC